VRIATSSPGGAGDTGRGFDPGQPPRHTIHAAVAALAIARANMRRIVLGKRAETTVSAPRSIKSPSTIALAFAADA
jgi:hypothetical protein